MIASGPWNVGVRQAVVDTLLPAKSLMRTATVPQGINLIAVDINPRVHHFSGSLAPPVRSDVLNPTGKPSATVSLEAGGNIYIVYTPHLIDPATHCIGLRVSRMFRIKAWLAGKGKPLAKRHNTEAGHS